MNRIATLMALALVWAPMAEAGKIKLGGGNVADIISVVETDASTDITAIGVMGSGGKLNGTIGLESDMLKLGPEQAGLGFTLDLSYQRFWVDRQLLSKAPLVEEQEQNSGIQGASSAAENPQEKVKPGIDLGTRGTGNATVLMLWFGPYVQAGKGTLDLSFGLGTSRTAVRGNAYLTHGDGVTDACLNATERLDVMANCQRTDYNTSKYGGAAGLGLSYKEEAWGASFFGRAAFATEGNQGLVAGNVGLYGYLYF